ncbi:F-box/WD repeat-containing protein 8 [Patella vulgata]|uniref:F-box/WD repeat-containing protein 8 n=1 Tax=Patella vulgata TaxID=6465 RepID=UPI0024A97273|nr:F-box/WD repeat-containing protein 8 [Patella vulgata]
MEDRNDLEHFRRTWTKELNQRKSLQCQQKRENQELASTESAENELSVTNTASSSSNGSMPNHCEIIGNRDSSTCVVSNASVKSHNLHRDKSGTLQSNNKNMLEQIQRGRGENFLAENNIVNNDTETEGYYPFILLGKMLKNSTEDLSPKKKTKNLLSPNTKRKYFDSDEEEMTVLIESSSQHRKKKEPKSIITKEIKSKCSNPLKKERFLDLFVADLDEINEIPFFDTNLPREVAIKIFNHLSVVDLCRCSQVSKSWRSLADDELLWCQICHKLGYEGEITTKEKMGWKNSVRQYAQRKKTLITNWKGRTGKFHQLQHVQGGILCSVDSYQDLIVAGYTNCDVKLWNMAEDDSVTFQSSNTSLIIDETSDIGTVSNQVQQVVTSKKYTAASYSHGFVDIWSNEDGTDPVYTLQSQHNSVGQICLSYHKTILGIVDDSIVNIIQPTVDSEMIVTDKVNLQSHVQKLQWLESENLSVSCDPMLIIGQYNKVHIYNPMNSYLTELHNMIDSNTKCFDCRFQPEILAVGVHFLSPVAEHKVKLYDLSTKQIISTLHGHTWIIQCLHLPEEQTHTLVSGSCDRKVRLYDLRHGGQPSITLIGHVGAVSSVQADDWKIVSSDVAGFVSVWDIRTSNKLWELHNRHPVEYCHFHDKYLMVGNIPGNKCPVLDTEYESATHRKYRGTVQVYDFLSDQTRDDIPDICLSTYDQPDAYNFNIRLAMPYDNL